MHKGKTTFPGDSCDSTSLSKNTLDEGALPHCYNLLKNDFETLEQACVGGEKRFDQSNIESLLMNAANSET